MMAEIKNLDATRFEAVDIRAIPDDQLDDIFGGAPAVSLALKKE